MPFTPSHVLAVLPPLRYRRALRLDATALAIGAMAPDFEYFLNGRLKGDLSHSVLGLVVFDLPMTLVLATLWAVLVAPFLTAIAPAPIARRGLGPSGALFWRRGWGAIASVVASALLGAATHLAWDDVTHGSGYLVRKLAVLRLSVEVPWFGHLPINRVIQHISSVVGLVGVAIAATIALRRRPVGTVPPRPPLGRTLLAINLLGGVGVAAARMYVLYPREWGAPDSMVVAAISGALLGTLVASVVARPRR